ncbi:MAG: cupin domain-containing protein [Candidatus Heimdallarchaeota archaeon]|nr:cupin domain-containing protein [Candidatus Heimdallarchaeota archaeon]MCK5144366.1 cupin domain-containing protein [Candidatus Heimdallarchaeota archaeon]
MGGNLEDKYSIDTEIKYKPLERINIPEIISNCSKKWQNISLCQVNESVIRLGVIEGEFHWHKHDEEDEFFYVIEGKLLIDLEDQTVELNPHEGFLVPKKIVHKTRAPVRTAILMFEGSNVKPTGDT